MSGGSILSPIAELVMGGAEVASGTAGAQKHPAESFVGILGGMTSLINSAVGFSNVAVGGEAGAAYGGAHGLLGLGGATAAVTGGLIGGGGGVGLGSGLGHMAGTMLGGHISEDAQSALTWGGGAAGLIAGAACPALAPFIAGAGLISHFAGMGAEALEHHGHTTAAEGVSTLGMAGSGAALGAGIGSVVPAVGTAVGAALGGGLGGLVGGAMSIFGDDAAGPNEGVGVDGHRITGEEGVGIAGMAGGGALLGAGIGSIVPAIGTAIGAGVGGLIGGAAGLIGSLWD